jgi:hypothetical protein
MRRVLLVLSSAAVLAGCVAPTRQPVAPVQPPPVTIAPPPVTTPPGPPDDTGVEPGLWSYAATASGSAARFGVTPQSAILAIQCDRSSRGVSIMVSRSVPASGGTVTLRASSMVRSVAAEGNGTFATIRLTARDPILDALAFSRGRFGVALDGVERAFPAWPEFTRVVEDCRG